MRVVSSVTYLTPAEVAQLAASTGASQSSTFVKRQSQLLGFLQALGSRIGFPQRTVATAQLLFLRFYLFYSPNEFIPQEVALACAVVAAKINDTPKKPREVILSSWALRYPDLIRCAPNVKAAGIASAVGGKSNAGLDGRSSSSPSAAGAVQLGLGIISESDVDPAVLEKERKRIVSIESLVLQSIAFDFNVQVVDNFRFTVKIARQWKADVSLGRLAWQITADCHRTYAPLIYPPSTIALASLYCAALLQQKGTPDAQRATEVVARLRSNAIGETNALHATIDSVEEVVHSLLDLYSAASNTLSSNALSSSATPISPATPASPAEPIGSEQGMDGRTSNSSAGRKLATHVYSPSPFGLLFWISDILSPGAPIVGTDIVADLTQIKIYLRQEEEKRRTSAQRAEQPSAAAMLVRPFDKGGVIGDIEQLLPADVVQLTEAWQERGQEKQYASLQRFLF